MLSSCRLHPDPALAVRARSLSVLSQLRLLVRARDLRRRPAYTPAALARRAAVWPRTPTSRRGATGGRVGGQGDRLGYFATCRTRARCVTPIVHATSQPLLLLLLFLLIDVVGSTAIVQRPIAARLPPCGERGAHAPCHRALRNACRAATRAASVVAAASRQTVSDASGRGRRQSLRPPPCLRLANYMVPICSVASTKSTIPLVVNRQTHTHTHRYTHRHTDTQTYLVLFFFSKNFSLRFRVYRCTIWVEAQPLVCYYSSS